jgi:hypothetical protein
MTRYTRMTVAMSVGNNGILDIDKGDNMLPADDDSGTLRTNDNSDMPSGSGDTTVPIINAIGAGSSHNAEDILATIDGSGAIGAICGGFVAIGGGAADVGVDALRVGVTTASLVWATSARATDARAAVAVR